MKTSVLWRKGDRRLTEEGLKIWDHSIAVWASPVAQMVKNPPSVLETGIQSLGQEDLLGEEMNDKLIQYSCRDNFMTEEPDRLNKVYGIAKEWDMTE